MMDTRCRKRLIQWVCMLEVQGLVLLLLYPDTQAIGQSGRAIPLG